MCYVFLCYGEANVDLFSSIFSPPMFGDATCDENSLSDSGVVRLCPSGCIELLWGGGGGGDWLSCWWVKTIWWGWWTEGPCFAEAVVPPGPITIEGRPMLVLAIDEMEVVVVVLVGVVTVVEGWSLCGITPWVRNQVLRSTWTHNLFKHAMSWEESLSAFLLLRWKENKTTSNIVFQENIWKNLCVNQLQDIMVTPIEWQCSYVIFHTFPSYFVIKLCFISSLHESRFVSSCCIHCKIKSFTSAVSQGGNIRLGNHFLICTKTGSQ